MIIYYVASNLVGMCMKSLKILEKVDFQIGDMIISDLG